MSLNNYKTVHVFSVFPNLAQTISDAVPEINVKNVKIRAFTGKFIWDMPVGKEEIEDLADAHILIADNNLVPKVLYHMPNIEWVQSTWAGIEVITNEVKKHPNPPEFPVTRYSGSSFGQIMGEYVLAQIINREREFYLHYKNAKLNKLWKKDVTWDYRSTNEITLTILGGCGAIGSHIARMFHQNGAKVYGYGRSERTEKEIKEIPLDRYSTKLEDILPECDYIVSVLPSTAATIGLLNDGKLQLCAKKKPVLINVGRGTLIDDNEIIKALDNKWISGAVLDVFTTEPLPPESPLWSRDEVLITPHVAAISRPKDMANLFKDNYRRFINGERMKYVIDWNEGY